MKTEKSTIHQEKQIQQSKESYNRDMRLFGFFTVISLAGLIICIYAFSNGNIYGDLVLVFIISLFMFIFTGGMFISFLSNKNK